MYKIFSALAFAAAVTLSPAAASTVQDLDMSQNQWIVLEFDGTNSVDLIVTPDSTDGSFSYTYAFSGTGCGDNIYWTCMPSSLDTNTIYSNYLNNFGEGWFDKKNPGSVTTPLLISYLQETWNNVFVYFRVTSGSGSISQVAQNVPAAIPLPAALPMLLAGLGGLGLVARRRRKAA